MANSKRETEKENSEVCVVLQSVGGVIDASPKIVKILGEVAEKYSVYVPFIAKSAATLIALGAEKLYLSPLSELGPIDPNDS